MFKTDGEAPLFLQIPVKTRDEIIPPGSQGRIVDNFVNNLDLSKVVATYERGGAPAFHPKSLLKVILLAYLNNIYGCRPISEMAAADLRCYYFLEGGTPSFNTINRFRSRRLGPEGVLEIFRQLLEMLLKEGLVTFEQTYIDGTLIESRASRTKIVWQQSVRRYAELNARHIQEILNGIRDVQQEEERQITDTGTTPDDGPGGKDGDREASPHPDGGKRTKRPASVHPTEEFIRQTRESLDDISLSKAKKDELSRRLDRAEELIHQDRMCGDRSGTASTDPDSIALHPKSDPTHKGPCLPMYNTMLITNNQFILDYYLGGVATDMSLFPLMMKDVGARYAGSRMAADAGFGSYANILLAQSYGIVPFFKYNLFDREQAARYTPDPFVGANFPYDTDTDTLQCPAGQILHAVRTISTTEHGIRKDTTTFRTDSCSACPLKVRCHQGRHQSADATCREVELNIDWWTNVRPGMRERLISELGQRLLHQRSKDVEPTNAHLLWAGKYARFRHFGLDKCGMDLGLRAIAQNLTRYLNLAVKAAGSTPVKTFFCAQKGLYRAISTLCGQFAPKTPRSGIRLQSV